MKCSKCQFENPSDSSFCAKCGTQIRPPGEKFFSSTKTLQTPIKELATGTIFAARYEVIEELGKGGMGKVYKVLDRKIKEKVALKLLKPEIASDEETIERFSNELRFARKIAHRNVCRMYDLGEEQGTHYITMEYVSGEDLKSTILRVGQLSLGKTVSTIKQVCEGLAEAHRLGVVHRDLKPQNIMIDKEGNAKIMDFGIARSLKAKGITGAGVMIGTPEYMSPEQVEGKEADQRADIYALGVILYEMLTGHVPFEGDTPFSVAYKQKNEAPSDPKKFNSQIPDDLSHLVLRCMEKEREKRYQSTEEISSELTKIERGIPTTERIIPKRKPFTSREVTVTFGIRKLFIPALVFIILVIAGFVIWKVIPRKEPVKSSIAVISFKNQTGDKAFDYLQEAIPNLLITSLEQSKYLSVTTWERMKDLLKQMGKEGAEVINEDLGFEICRKDGIDAIALGSFVKAGETFATDVKVLDVASKRLLKSASSKGEGVSSILKKQIDELSQNISRGIGLSERKIEATQPKIADVTTSSLDAYNYFLKGREEDEKFYYEEARKSFEKAVEIDPSFAVAYLYLARANGQLGNQKERNEAYEKAKSLSGKATEKERLYIEAAYAGAIERDPEKRIRLLKEIVEKYPKEKVVYYDLGVYYDGRKLFTQAIAELNKALELDPNYGEACNHIAYTYADMGDYEKAIEYFKRYASLSPGDANPIDSMAELYFRMGDLDEAIAKYREALKVKPDFFSSYFALAYVYALKEDYQEAMRCLDQLSDVAPSLGIKGTGYFYKSYFNFWLGSYEQTLSELRKLIDLAEALGYKPGKASSEWLMGWIYSERGEGELSRKYFKSWFDLASQSSPSELATATAYYNLSLGMVDLKEAKVDSARARLTELKSLIQRVHPAVKAPAMFTYDLFQGEILLAEGSVDKAISILERASPLGKPPAIQNVLISHNSPCPVDVLARAYIKKGELDKAIAEYERLITFDPKREERILIHPLYHYRLAKLYEQKGMKQKAKDQYQKFLDICEDADKDLPDLIEAQKRLASLQ
jgi:serine/threonine protein kinase/cytochrome c-type biogenesis protein CcmH/NrfG